MRHIPNILSAIRLVLVGVFMGLFLSQKYVAALCVFVFAFVTDVLDGQLARQYGWITDLGKLLDPLADKLMTVAALICIYIGKHQPVYLIIFILMFIKELLMLIGGLFMVRRKVVAMADWPGKLATGLFAVGIVLTLISFLPASVEPWNLYFLIAATVLSYFALIFYATKQLPRAFQKAAGEEETTK
jgi:cardiolipin synthase